MSLHKHHPQTPPASVQDTGHVGLSRIRIPPSNSSPLHHALSVFRLMICATRYPLLCWCSANIFATQLHRWCFFFVFCIVFGLFYLRPILRNGLELKRSVAWAARVSGCFVPRRSRLRWLWYCESQTNGERESSRCA